MRWKKLNIISKTTNKLTLVLLISSLCDEYARAGMVLTIGEGRCAVENTYCFANYEEGSNYGSYEDCTFTADNIAGPLMFTHFDIEGSGTPCSGGWDDFLTIGGAMYCGEAAPTNLSVTAGEQITWTSDGSATRTGFRACVVPVCSSACGVGIGCGFAEGSSAPTCLSCPVSKYSDESSTTAQCVSCRLGYSTPSTNSTSPSDCNVCDDTHTMVDGVCVGIGLIAGNCTVDGNCFSGSRYDCTFIANNLAGPLQFSEFDIVYSGTFCSGGEFLTVDGRRYCGDAAPTGLSVASGEEITWNGWDGGAVRACVVPCSDACGVGSGCGFGGDELTPSCLSCPVSKYSDVTSAEPCVSCPLFYSTEAAGATAISDCNVCVGGAGREDDGACVSLERENLKELYRSTNGEDWIRRKWNITDDMMHHCYWKGISCQNDGRTRTLFLDDNNLVGTLPTFDGLPHLTVLGFFGNKLTGPVPSFENNPRLNVITMYKNDFTGTIPSSLRARCASGKIECLFAPNNYMCDSGSRLNGLSCTPCPHPERCNHDPTTNFCTGGYDDLLCMSCPTSFYDNGNSCVPCSASLAGMTTLLIFTVVVLLLSILLFFGRNSEFVKRNQPKVSLKNLSIAKQLGLASQLLMTISSFVIVPLPMWMRTLKEWIKNFSDVIPSINGPCVEGLSNLRKPVVGLITCAVTAVVVSLLLLIAIIAKRKQIQTVAGFIVTQSVLICLIASTDLVKLTSSTTSNVYEAESLGEHAATLTTNIAQGFGEITVVMIIAAFFDRLFRFASKRVNAARRDLGSATESTEASTLLPFWASFCSPYVSRSADFERIVVKRKYYSFLIPPVMFLVSTLAIYSASLSFIISTPNIDGILLSAAAIQSILFVSVQTWYLGKLIKRPYVSTRSSSHYGDPLNSADITTTRLLSYSSALLSSITAFKRLIDNDDHVSVYSNVVAVFIVVFLLAPQYQLFRNLRLAVESARITLLRGRSREKESEDSASSRTRANSAMDSSAGAIIDEMMDTTSSLKLFALEKKLLNDPSLSDGERLRWRVPKEAKKTVSWGWFACSALVSVLKFALFLLFVGVGLVAIFALVVLSGVNESWGVEWVLFGGSIVGVLLQELLRVRWERKERFEALKFRFTRDASDDNDDDDDDDDATRNPISFGADEDDTYL